MSNSWLDAEVVPQIVHLASTQEEAQLVTPLEQAGFAVERYVGSGPDIANAVFALLTGAEG
jgi:Holliday junction resolvase